MSIIRWQSANSLATRKCNLQNKSTTDIQFNYQLLQIIKQELQTVVCVASYTHAYTQRTHTEHFMFVQVFEIIWPHEFQILQEQNIQEKLHHREPTTVGSADLLVRNQ